MPALAGKKYDYNKAGKAAFKKAKAKMTRKKKTSKKSK